MHGIEEVEDTIEFVSFTFGCADVCSELPCIGIAIIAAGAHIESLGQTKVEACGTTSHPAVAEWCPTIDIESCGELPLSCLDFGGDTTVVPGHGHDFRFADGIVDGKRRTTTVGDAQGHWHNTQPEAHRTVMP